MITQSSQYKRVGVDAIEIKGEIIPFLDVQAVGSKIPIRGENISMIIEMLRSKYNEWLIPELPNAVENTIDLKTVNDIGSVIAGELNDFTHGSEKVFVAKTDVGDKHFLQGYYGADYQRAIDFSKAVELSFDELELEQLDNKLNPNFIRSLFYYVSKMRYSVRWCYNDDFNFVCSGTFYRRDESFTPAVTYNIPLENKLLCERFEYGEEAHFASSCVPYLYNSGSTKTDYQYIDFNAFHLYTKFDCEGLVLYIPFFTFSGGYFSWIKLDCTKVSNDKSSYVCKFEIDCSKLNKTFIEQIARNEYGIDPYRTGTTFNVGYNYSHSDRPGIGAMFAIIKEKNDTLAEIDTLGWNWQPS